MISTINIQDLQALDPQKRHDIFWIVSARMSNINGDPDAANLPRTNPFDQHGIATAVSGKRKIRDYIATKMLHEDGQPVRGYELLIRHGDVISTQIYKALASAGVEAGESAALTEAEYEELAAHDLGSAFVLEETTIYYNKSLKAGEIKALFSELEAAGVGVDALSKLRNLTGKPKVKESGTNREARKQSALPVMLERFVDARLFGFTAPGDVGGWRGPVQMSDAVTTAPVNILENTLTRVARAKSTEDKDATANFGQRAVVDFGVYVFNAFVNPPLAIRSGVSAEDLKLLVEGMYYGYDLARSSSRADVRVEGIVIVTHDSQWGNAPIAMVEEGLMVDWGDEGGKKQVRVGYDANLLAGRAIEVQVIR